MLNLHAQPQFLKNYVNTGTKISSIYMHINYQDHYDYHLPAFKKKFSTFWTKTKVTLVFFPQISFIKVVHDRWAVGQWSGLVDPQGDLLATLVTRGLICQHAGIGKKSTQIFILYSVLIIWFNITRYHKYMIRWPCDKEMLSTLLALCEGNPMVTLDYP